MRIAGRRDRWVLVFLFLSLLLTPVRAHAEGMTKEQGDAILKELRQIRGLLERPQRPGSTPPTQGSPQEKVTLKLGADPAMGRDDAPVTIVEYTDYQCPYCNRFHTNTFPELKKNYIDTGKVRFIKRDLPLPFHPQALPAAKAARCAGDQGKFWEMHERLSASPANLGMETYVAFARELYLDTASFEGCIGSERHVAGIRENEQAAAAAGINGTPSFVVGMAKDDVLEGVRIVGAQPFDVFDRTIRELLAVQGGKAPAR